MSNYLEVNFCTPDDGLDYIYATMGAIYGATFIRHFDGVDPQMVRNVWKDQIGDFLTYKPSMDFAIQHLNAEFIPSAIKFRELCNKGPSIPSKQTLLENQPKEFNQAEHDKAKETGLEKLQELKKMFRGKF